jgi:ABC-2 type transport system ATP-binding protein
MPSCVEVRSLACVQGKRTTLQDVDLVLARGQVHGVLGPRWAGKTTLLRVLAGELTASSGTAQVPASVLLVGDDGRSPIEERLDPPTRRRVALARAVASGPDLLLVDEPAEGFDADTTAATRALVLRYAGQGGTVIWASKRLDVFLDLAAGVTLLTEGRVRYTGSAEGLATRVLSGLIVPLRHAA